MKKTVLATALIAAVVGAGALLLKSGGNGDAPKVAPEAAAVVAAPNVEQVTAPKQQVAALPTWPQWHVSPTGTLTSGCSNPAGPYCSLDWARSRKVAGETIWLHGTPWPAPPAAVPITAAGTYTIPQLAGATGHTFYASGAAGNSITLRNYPNERVRITSPGLTTGSNVEHVMYLGGSYVTYWGIEVTTSTNSDRITDVMGSQPNATEIGYGEGIAVRQNMGNLPGIKLVNMIVHDTRQVSIWAQALNAEVYGLISYYNGWYGTNDDGHGHGFYWQAQAVDSRKLYDSFLFHNFSHGFHAYGSGSAYFNDMIVKGNTMWGASDFPEVGGGGRNFIIAGGADPGAMRFNIDENRFYGNGVGDLVQIGWSSWNAPHDTDGLLTNNYLASNPTLLNLLIPAGITVTGNTFVYSALGGFTPANFPSNTYITPKSTYAGPAKVFVEPNDYEPGRANVTIFNWPLSPTVPVDLTGIVAVGSQYRVQHAMDFYGVAVKWGTYTGGTVDFPMTNLPIAAPAGNISKPPAYFPKFAAFVVLPVSGGAPSTPTVTSPLATASATATATAVPATSSPTRTATLTAVPPSPTSTVIPTAIPPSATSVPPTFTAIPPSATPVPTLTATSIPPSATPTKSPVPPTAIPPTATKTATPASVCWTYTPTPPPMVCVTVTATP